MALKKVFVNRAVVEENYKTGESNPVFTVYDGQNEHRTNSITVLGRCEIKYDPNGMEGSRVWIETFDKVVLKESEDGSLLLPV